MQPRVDIATCIDNTTRYCLCCPLCHGCMTCEMSSMETSLSGRWAYGVFKARPRRVTEMEIVSFIKKDLGKNVSWYRTLSTHQTSCHTAKTIPPFPISDSVLPPRCGWLLILRYHSIFLLSARYHTDSMEFGSLRAEFHPDNSPIFDR